MGLDRLVPAWEQSRYLRKILAEYEKFCLFGVGELLSTEFRLFLGIEAGSKQGPVLTEGGLELNICRVGFPIMLTDGVWAEVKVGNEHLRLFSEHNAQGVQASVYNVNPKSWIASSEPVEDIEQGKESASVHARAYLKVAANSDLPPLTWKESRSR